jgi:hypothetical protein
MSALLGCLEQILSLRSQFVSSCTPKLNVWCVHNQYILYTVASACNTQTFQCEFKPAHCMLSHQSLLFMYVICSVWMGKDTVYRAELSFLRVVIQKLHVCCCLFRCASMAIASVVFFLHYNKL